MRRKLKTVPARLSLVAGLMTVLLAAPAAAADASCNEGVEPNVFWCEETVAAGHDIENLLSLPSDDFHANFVFPQAETIRLGCQEDGGVIWLETTSNSGQTSVWHDLPQDDSGVWMDTFRFQNWGIGTLAEVQEWGAKSGFIQHPLECLLETKSGSLWRFALMMEAERSDGDADANRIPGDSVPPPVECQPAFDDVDCGHTFHGDIQWLSDEGITRGCNPPDNTRFCPDDYVTRGQMAAFLSRAFGLDRTAILRFDDVSEDHTFFWDIEALSAAGITRGCNPPDNTRFCPDDYVTRGQMAAFLKRALVLSDDGGGNLFFDDDGHTFESDIDKLAAAGVTKGCNPPVNTMFCPDDFVTRGQMAAFLKRALG